MSDTKPKTRLIDVVGMSFIPSYPDNLLRLREICEKQSVTSLGGGGDFGDDYEPEKLPAVIIRNPENEFDANACEVHIPALGRKGMVGHVPRDLAARLAPLMDAGVQVRGWVDFVRIMPGKESNPGLTIGIEVDRSTTHQEEA